ncbi:hypothetical protein IWZ00DRAFT_357996 [Phyllosticta capitalensis]|uniref:uncharacterized protein n=1 Tax=Phyllosticta capitalensis TaxID=121624 RepID=UPI00312DA2D2
MNLLRRSDNRIVRHDTFWQGKFKAFAIQSVAVFILLQLLFLTTMLYLYGSFYKQSTRVHNMRVLFVDFDEGIIGRSVPAAYAQMQAHNFPTVETHSVTEYATTMDVRNAVCQGHYWGAIYTHSGASARLSAALEGGAAATSYLANNTITVVWNAVRYPAFVASLVEANLQQLGNAAGSVYKAMNGTAALQSLNMTDNAAVQALLNPVTPTTAPIQPMTNGSRVMFNTAGMVMPVIAQFFFLMAINNISTQMRFLSRLPRFDNYLIRFFLSVLYTFVGALCMSGYIWAYREDWAVTSSDFALTWMVLWLLMHIHYFVFDVATAFVPMAFLPFIVLIWVILNITSTVTPFELDAGFYHWGYALPAHNVYELLISIWSEGCSNRSYRNLPILFAWWLVGNIASVFATRHRCHKAEEFENNERVAWEERIIRGDQEETTARPTTANSLEEAKTTGKPTRAHSFAEEGKRSEDRPRSVHSNA